VPDQHLFSASLPRSLRAWPQPESPWIAWRHALRLGAVRYRERRPGRDSLDSLPLLADGGICSILAPSLRASSWRTEFDHVAAIAQNGYLGMTSGGAGSLGNGKLQD
jgi:hypothetical protein